MPPVLLCASLQGYRKTFRHLQGASYTFDNLPMVTSKPGWYKNPDVPGQARYWDGQRWTNHVRDITPPKVEKPAEQAEPASAKPAIAFPWQTAAIGVQASETNDAGLKAYRPESYDEKQLKQGAFVPPDEPEPDYGRARRGQKNAKQFQKVVLTTLGSLAAGLVIGIVAGTIFVPNVQEPKVTEIVLIEGRTPETTEEAPTGATVPDLTAPSVTP